MKKIINLILTFGVLFSVTSCDLNEDPGTAIPPAEAYTMEYCQGMRGATYSGLKSILSGSYYVEPDLYADVLSVTISANNAGFYVFNWYMYATDQSVSGIWNGYYMTVMYANYALKHMQETLDYGAVSATDATTIKMFMGEMRFCRAFAMRRAALLFCEDYDPAKAETQPGLPYPKEWNPDAKLSRGTLAQLYANIEQDIVAAEAVVTTAGAPNSIYLTKDAIAAFRAQIALERHEYAKASQYAQSLYGAYPLITTKFEMERMWYDDASTENILQLEVLDATQTTVNSFADYIQATWMADLTPNVFYCSPLYVPEQHVVNLFGEQDIRMGVYIAKVENSTGAKYILSMRNRKGEGYLINKFKGNRTFQNSPQMLIYRSAPKMFRVADMYLIDAEAQYQLNGGGAGPLNDLRQSRGLEAVTVTGVDLWTEIKNERLREMLGEGGRLYDLKRWGDGFQRNFQTSITSLIDIDSKSYNQTMTQVSNNNKFVWPIPQGELSQNPNFGEQNAAYK